MQAPATGPIQEGNESRVPSGLPTRRSSPVDRVSYMKNVIIPWIKARVDAKSELGASLVEYALLVALIAVVCIIGITFLGTSANSRFKSIGSELD